MTTYMNLGDRNVLAYFDEATKTYIPITNVDGSINVNMQPEQPADSEEELLETVITPVTSSDRVSFPLLYASDDCLGLIKTIKIYRKDLTGQALLKTLYYESATFGYFNTRIVEDLVSI